LYLYQRLFLKGNKKNIRRLRRALDAVFQKLREAAEKLIIKGEGNAYGAIAQFMVVK